MNKNLSRILVCSAIVIAGMLAVGMMAHPKQISQQQSASPPNSPPPEQVTYSAFFHYVVDLKNQAADLERSGKNGSSLRSYVQLHAELNYEEGRMLDEIAAMCIQEVTQQDQKALAVIQKFKGQFPGGRVPKGAKLPPPPPELKVLQQQRDAIILRARDRLKKDIGEVGFNKVNDFIERNISPSIRLVR
jgi:hypothetical protein